MLTVLAFLFHRPTIVESPSHNCGKDEPQLWKRLSTIVGRSTFRFANVNIQDRMSQFIVYIGLNKSYTLLNYNRLKLQEVYNHLVGHGMKTDRTKYVQVVPRNLSARKTHKQREAGRPER